MDLQLTFTTHDDVPREAGRLVDSGLGASNDEAAPLAEVERLACFVRQPSGEVIGGVVGRTWGECCELQQVWVDRAQRRKGIGTQLIRRFEAAARERGCRTFYLETFTFQAPALYLGLGYEVAFELKAFPHDIVKFVMMKRVAAAE
jgi:ribosomal protein S18 acetylase RimI-like enzyme